MSFTSAEFIVCSLVQTPMCWKWKENSISISSSTGHICISLSMYTCVGVNQCRCYYDNSEMQLQTGISHETLFTLPVSFPSCACAELMSGHKSYNIPFSCGWLSPLTNLPFTGNQQMALLILLVFKYKQLPGPAQESVRLCLHLSHSTMQGLDLIQEVESPI